MISWEARVRLDKKEDGRLEWSCVVPMWREGVYAVDYASEVGLHLRREEYAHKKAFELLVETIMEEGWSAFSVVEIKKDMVDEERFPGLRCMEVRVEGRWKNG